MRAFAALLMMAALALPVLAQPVAPLPRERPAGTTSPEAIAAPALVPLPRARPTADAAQEAEPAAEPEPITETEPPATTEGEPPAEAETVPEKPPRIYQAACPAMMQGMVEARMLEPIADGSCGERSPLGVTGILVNGRMVTLSGEVTINCGMATALPEWAAAIDGYLEARENSRLARIIVGTSYFCRPRNGVAGADVSEHGFANALDVVGFELEDGRTITLPAGWTDPLSAEGRLLRYAHDAACSRFTTTLGPEANALHEDHLHVDLGCHGQRCTARLCE